MSERLTGIDVTERVLDRVDVIERLNEIKPDGEAEIGLQELIDLNDTEVLGRLRLYADKWGWDPWDVLIQCNIYEEQVRTIRGGESSEV